MLCFQRYGSKFLPTEKQVTYRSISPLEAVSNAYALVLDGETLVFAKADEGDRWQRIRIQGSPVVDSRADPRIEREITRFQSHLLYWPYNPNIEESTHVVVSDSSQILRLEPQQ